MRIFSFFKRKKTTPKEHVQAAPPKRPAAVPTNRPINPYNRVAVTTTLDKRIAPNVKKEETPLERRRRIKGLRAARRDRHNLIWQVLRTLIEYNTLINTDNFFDVKKSVSNLQWLRSGSENFSVSEKEIATAIRFIHRKAYLGECDADISNLNIQCFYDCVATNFEPMLYKSFDWLENYWDSYYESRRGKKRIERLEYYLEWLGKEAQDKLYWRSPRIKSRIASLKDKYAALLVMEQSK